MAHDVFISHSSVDKKAADAICHSLEQNGVKCWIAPRDIQPGANYGGEIIRGIKECTVFLLIFSHEANVSPAVAKEVERAVLGYNKIVMPFRIEDVPMSANLEFFLTDVHWLDAYPDDTVFENLVTAVKNALGMNAGAAIAPAPAFAPAHAPAVESAQSASAQSATAQSATAQSAVAQFSAAQTSAASPLAGTQSAAPSSAGAQTSAAPPSAAAQTSAAPPSAAPPSAAAQSAAAQTAAQHPWWKKKWVLPTGVAAVVIIVALLLVPGLLKQDTTGTNPPSGPAGNDLPATADQGQGLTQEQQATLDQLTQQFPEKINDLATGVLDDKAFIAAAGQATLTNPVFGPQGLDITMLLPDPGAESLDKLGIESYTAYSGAQGYIRDNYAKIIAMDTPDRIEIPVSFYYQDGAGGGQTLDWTLGPVSWGLNDYLNVFLPHIEQYLSDKGFSDAALELLMPDFRNMGNTPGETECLNEYFSVLADALSLKGVDIGGQTVVDSAQIEKALSERFARTWVSDRVSVVTQDNMRPYSQYLHMRSPAPTAFFSSVREGLDAQYKSGNQTKPSSSEDLESAFSAAARAKADGLLDDPVANSQGLVIEQEYPFGWEALGEQGAPACPGLVEGIRTYLNAFDFDLMFMS